MEYISLADAESDMAKLGRPIRAVRLRQLCQQGRVDGAIKIGGSWAVPRESLPGLAQDVRKPGRPVDNKNDTEQ